MTDSTRSIRAQGTVAQAVDAQPIVEACALSFAYATSPDVLVLKNLHLAIAEGECVAVLGESGSGKSTLLKLMCGLLKPLSGHILLRGKPLEKPDEGIAMLFQNYGLFPWRTVEENIILPALIKGRRPDKEKVLELLDYLGLSKHRKRYPAELSGGQKQRTALGRAVMSNASVIFMDEPFSALDVKNREKLQIFMKGFLSDMTMSSLIVTHSIEEAMIMGDRLVVLDSTAGAITHTFSGCRTKATMDAQDYETMQKIRDLLV